MATGDYHDQFPSLAISLSKKNGQSSTGGSGGGNGNGKNNMKKKKKYRSISLADPTTAATNYGKPAFAAGGFPPRDLLAARVLAYEGKSPSLLPPPPPAVITRTAPENVVLTVESVLPDLEVEAMDGPWRQLFSKPASSNMVASLPAHKEVSETPMAIEEETVQVSNEFSDTTTEDDVVDEVDEILVTSKQISETSVVIEKVPELISVDNGVTSDAEEDDHLCKKLEEEAVQFVHGQKLEELKQQLGELEASAVIVREAIIKLEKGEIW